MNRIYLFVFVAFMLLGYENSFAFCDPATGAREFMDCRMQEKQMEEMQRQQEEMRFQMQMQQDQMRRQQQEMQDQMQRQQQMMLEMQRQQQMMQGMQ